MSAGVRGEYMRELEWAATNWASRWGSGCVGEHLSELVGRMWRARDSG